MADSSAPRPGARRRALGALAAVIGMLFGVAGLTVGAAPTASASLGSVPAEVTAYVTSGAMVARLNDVYGPNASGTAGITFDDTTKPGPISRVYEWTADRLANRPTDHPVQLTNNWVVPITIGGASVGLATIWINPQTVAAELAEFTPSAELGTALTTVPATAALVRDPATGAWLALADGKRLPGTYGTQTRFWIAPGWLILLSLGVAGLCRKLWIVQRNRERQANQLCRNCGYDLRASPDRCCCE